MPRKRVESRWPWPADTPLEIRERVARVYREIALKHAPDATRIVDASIVGYGQSWAVLQPVLYEPDDLLSVNQLADYANVKPRTIDTWKTRGLKPTHTVDGLRYRWSDVLDYQRQRRLQRRGKTA